MSAEMNYIVAGAGGEMLAAVMGGHITVVTGGFNEFAAQIKEGKLRALAISSPERLPGIDIPTLKEQGVDVELVNWRALMASGDIKPADLKTLDAAMGKMVRSPQWQAMPPSAAGSTATCPPSSSPGSCGTSRPASRPSSTSSAC